jgi:hypothetical protein
MTRIVSAYFPLKLWIVTDAPPAHSVTHYTAIRLARIAAKGQKPARNNLFRLKGPAPIVAQSGRSPLLQTIVNRFARKLAGIALSSSADICDHVHSPFVHTITVSTRHANIRELLGARLDGLRSRDAAPIDRALDSISGTRFPRDCSGTATLFAGFPCALATWTEVCRHSQTAFRGPDQLFNATLNRKYLLTDD